MDYVRVTRLGGAGGVTESCGTTVNVAQIIDGKNINSKYVQNDLYMYQWL